MIKEKGLCFGNLEEDELNSKMKPRYTCAQFDRENSHLDPERPVKKESTVPKLKSKVLLSFTHRKKNREIMT